MSHKYNDIHINMNDENAYNVLRNLQENLEEILTKEFREKVPDFHFLTIVQNDGYYEEQKNPLVVSYAIENEKGEILRDSRDIVQHYFKQQGINLVSVEEWQETKHILQEHAIDNDGEFNEELYESLISEAESEYRQVGRTLFWEVEGEIKPIELAEAIKNTIDGVHWVIEEYAKDNPNMQVFMPGPYGVTFRDLEEDKVNWGEKYPHMRSINTLIENKASAEEMLHNVKGYKQ